MGREGMIRAYRLVHLNSVPTQPKLWEWEQPHIQCLIENARRFDHQVMQRYFRDDEALKRENDLIWERNYRTCRLFDHILEWRIWLGEYRGLMVELLEMAEK